MMERTNIPSSPECGHWETLLADALDGLLRPEDQAVFAAHMETCPMCTALYEESKRGREWLGFLAMEPEVPAGLLDKILAKTGPGQTDALDLVPSAGNVIAMPQPWQRPGMMGRVYGQARRFAEPRLLMTAAMAFFSIALTLNLTNVHLSSLRISDLRPSSLRSFMERRATMASTPIIRYYDHLRFVYEVETRMRELRRTSDNDDSQPKPSTGTPGQSKQDPTPQNQAPKNGGSRMDPPQQSVSPHQRIDSTAPDSLVDSTEPLIASQTFPALSLEGRPAHSGGSVLEVRERSTTWTA
jgi:hypothetical protein